MHLYRNCGDLPILNFDIIYKTNDFKWLVVGYDGYDEIKVPKGAPERWEEIRSEWIKMIDDNTIAYYHQLLLEVIYLQTRYETVRQLLDIMWRLPDMDGKSEEIYINALAEWKYKWNKKNARHKELERMFRIWKQSENKLSLKIDELKKMKEENDYSEDANTLEKQALVIEQITGIKIDIRKDSVARWVEANKIATQLNEQRRKAYAK